VRRNCRKALLRDSEPGVLQKLHTANFNRGELAETAGDQLSKAKTDGVLSIASFKADDIVKNLAGKRPVKSGERQTASGVKAADSQFMPSSEDSSIATRYRNEIKPNEIQTQTVGRNEALDMHPEDKSEHAVQTDSPSGVLDSANSQSIVEETEIDREPMSSISRRRGWRESKAELQKKKQIDTKASSSHQCTHLSFNH
jgi:hypothetical protein